MEAQKAGGEASGAARPRGLSGWAMGEVGDRDRSQAKHGGKSFQFPRWAPTPTGPDKAPALGLGPAARRRLAIGWKGSSRKAAGWERGWQPAVWTRALTTIQPRCVSNRCVEGTQSRHLVRAATLTKTKGYNALRTVLGPEGFLPLNVGF